MTVGNVIALRQENIKRMLAYSSIAHAGYILVGIVSATAEGISGVLIYLLAYTFMNVGAFAVVSIIAAKGEERALIKDYAGLGRSYPLLAATLAIFLFSLAGIPPMAGFIGKFYIFKSAIGEGFIWLAIIGMMNSVISVYYYLRVTVAMYFGEDEKVAPQYSFGAPMVVALILSVYGSLYIGLFPSKYIEFAKMAFLTF
jgi:NADH-quinone oxidoreductase subunit N